MAGVDYFFFGIRIFGCCVFVKYLLEYMCGLLAFYF